MDNTGQVKPTGGRPARPGVDDGQRFVIRTPAAAFKGERAGCQFCEGVAYTDDAARAAECRGLGYAVEDRKQPPPAAGKW